MASSIYHTTTRITSIFSSSSFRLKLLTSLFASILFALLLVPGSALASDIVQTDQSAATETSQLSQCGSSALQDPPPATHISLDNTSEVSDLIDLNEGLPTEVSPELGGNIEQQTSSTPQQGEELQAAPVITPQALTAFAVYSATDKSLCFYKRSSVPAVGSTFEGKVVTKLYTGIETTAWAIYGGAGNPAWYDDETVKNNVVTATVVDDGISPISTYCWFWSMPNLESIDVTKLNTSKVTNMGAMFGGNSKITTIDISSFDTSSVVTDAAHPNYNGMTWMFYYMSNLTTIIVGDKWNTSKITSGYYMFKACPKLKGGKESAPTVGDYGLVYARLDGGPSAPGFFSKWTDLTTLDISDFEDQIWSAAGNTPDTSITIDGIKLTQGISYSLSYQNNKNVGSATVTITGLRNYQGSLERTFSITPAKMEDAIGSVIRDGSLQIEDDAFLFTGGNLEPGVLLTLVGIKVDESNYNLSYKNNKEVGKATITIAGQVNPESGIQNIFGSATVDFEIGTVDINKAVISLESTGPIIYTGIEQLPAFTVRLYGNIINPENYSYSYSDNTNAGTATITLKGENSLSGNTTHTFTIEKADIDSTTVKLSSDSFIYTGSSFEPEVTITLGNHTLKSSEYRIDYPTNSSVTPEGQPAIVTITANENNFTGSTTATFKIIPMSIKDAVINFAPDSYIFTGSQITPAFSVTLGNKTLSSSDYSISSYSTDRVDAGDVTLTITGKGNYEDSLSGIFHIAPADLAQTDVTLTHDSPFYENGAYNFSGNTYTPAVSVKLGSYTLFSDAYSVAYINNVNAGEATVRITPASPSGNFTGTKTVIFTINPVKLSEVLTNPGAVTIKDLDTVTDENGNKVFGFTYTGDPIKPAVSIVLGDDPLVEDRDYELLYNKNTGAGNAEITIKGKPTSLEGEYKVTFYIAPAEIPEFTGQVPDQEFTGDKIKPTLELTFHGTALIEGRDYDLSYGENTEQGIGTIIATGKGNFQGSTHSIEFRIVGRLINHATFAFDPSLLQALNSSPIYTYSGSEHTPAFTLVDNNETLKAGTHFTFRYVDNINAGESTDSASIVIEGIGDYGGILRPTFTILPLAINNDSSLVTTSIDQSNALPGYENIFVYDGSPIEPAVSVIVNGITLKAGTDYVLLYKNNASPGPAGVSAATITIRGVGNYTGDIAESFLIKKKPEIIEGHGQSWITDSTEHVSFRSDAPIDEFQDVRVDGELLTHLVHYTLTEGSTIVKLVPEFLATLSPGIHTIDVQSQAGTAHSEFMIEEKPAVQVSPTASSASAKPTHANYRPSTTGAKRAVAHGATTLGIADTTEEATQTDAAASESMDDVASKANSAFEAKDAKASESNSSTISPVWPWILVALGAAALLFLFVILARRNKKDAR